MTVMYAVTDFSGKINQVNRQIVGNAAIAIGSMAVDYAKNQKQHFASPNSVATIKRRKPLVVASMNGITQQCVLIVEAELEKLGYDVISFHCVGT